MPYVSWTHANMFQVNTEVFPVKDGKYVLE